MTCHHANSVIERPAATLSGRRDEVVQGSRPPTGTVPRRCVRRGASSGRTFPSARWAATTWSKRWVFRARPSRA